LPPETRDSEEYPFGVSLVTEYYVYHFGNLPCFVGEAIYVVYRYGVKDAPNGNTFRTDKILIYEAAHSSRVQKRLDGVYLAGVGGTDLNREDHGRFTGIESIGGESFGESLLPFGPLRQGFPVWSGREECVYRFTDICIDFFYVQYSEPIY